MRGALLILVLVAPTPACVPPACSDAEERALQRDVDLLVGGEDPAADEAAERLAARGRSAIVDLEAGLYEAEPPARRRIVRVLCALGSPEVAPILAHLARRDPDKEVRAAAAAGLQRLTPQP